MVSIKDIAKECEVSVATVSKALNNQNDISQATKKRILMTAEKMGYTPNIAAKALRTNRTNNIGVLYTDLEADVSLTHEYFSQILESFKSEAGKKGYDITFINHTIAGRKSSFLNHSLYRNFDGVGIIVADFKSEEVIELAKSSIPVVAIDYSYEKCAAVLSDNSKGVSALVRYAYEHGHRKIAFIHGEYTEVTNERVSGFYSTCRELGIDVPREYVKESRYRDGDLCSQCLKELMALEDRPTCILFPDDFAYIACLGTFKQMNLRVPEDISIMGYDGINIAKIMGITTYEQNAEALGRMAAQKLIHMIENPDSEPECNIVSGKLLEGKTLQEI